MGQVMLPLERIPGSCLTCPACGYIKPGFCTPEEYYCKGHPDQKTDLNRRPEGCPIIIEENDRTNINKLWSAAITLEDHVEETAEEFDMVLKWARVLEDMFEGKDEE